MEDIVPELLNKLSNAFKEKYDKNRNIAEIIKKAENGTATYVDSHVFAKTVGEIWADTYSECVSADVLPDGKMYYNIASRLIQGPLKKDYDLISGITKQVQENLNKKANIGLKAIVPPINQNRIDGIIDRLSDAEKFDDIAWILKSPVVNFSQNVVDEFIKVNAEAQHNAGLHPKIVRRMNRPCCQWCANLAGSWNYPEDAPEGLYQRHENCDCVVEFDPGDGKRQDVWSKDWRQKTKRDEVLDNLAIAQGNVARKFKKIDVLKKKLSPAEREIRARYKMGASTNSEELGVIRRELGKVPTDRLHDTIDYFTEEIRNKSIENAIVVQRDGTVVHFIGTKDGVMIEDVDLRGAYVTHNHPISNGICSFGQDDFIFLRENQDMELFQCVNPEYVYSAKVLHPINELVYNNLYKDALASRTDDYQDRVFELLAERGYIEYVKRKI